MKMYYIFHKMTEQNEIKIGSVCETRLKCCCWGFFSDELVLPGKPLLVPDKH